MKYTFVVFVVSFSWPSWQLSSLGRLSVFFRRLKEENVKTVITSKKGVKKLLEEEIN